jgi:uncharacterized protein YegL
MGFQKAERRATANTPQIVTFIIDDSGSMKGNKARQVTEEAKNALTSMQASNLGSSGSRFIVNICKFGDVPRAIAVASAPADVQIPQLVFDGDSGKTDMPIALRWAREALQKSLERCKANPNYREQDAPNPLCIFLSDGENTGGDVTTDAISLRSVPFHGGNVDVVAVGVEMQDSHFEVMKAIASRPEYAVRISDDEVANFLAAVDATIVDGKSLGELIERFS